MPAFVNPVSQSMPGFGAPSYYGSVLSVANSGLGQTISIGNTSTTPAANGTPFNPGGGPYPSRGKFHIRGKGLTGTFLISSIVVQDSGGVFWQVGGPVSADSSGMTNYDFSDEFNTDAAIAAVIFNWTSSTAAGTVDCEVSLV